MEKFLFCFGYQTPDQLGLDEEDSACVFIFADNREKAKEWGIEIARVFVDQLNEKSKKKDLESWEPIYYAHWIEEDVETFLNDHTGLVVEVEFGKHPSFAALSDGRY